MLLAAQEGDTVVHAAVSMARIDYLEWVEKQALPLDHNDPVGFAVFTC